jgi:hypothetical protein
MSALNDQIPTRAAAVTKSDTVSNFGCALFVGGAGNVVLTTEGGDVVTFTGVLAGTTLVQRFTKVMAATTATNLVRQW